MRKSGKYGGIMNGREVIRIMILRKKRKNTFIRSRSYIQKFIEN